MTLSRFDRSPVRRQPITTTPRDLDPADVSIVIPVRDNPAGIARAIGALGDLPVAPREVIVVDSASALPLEQASLAPGRVKLVRTDTPGPARARNLGWRAASGSWVLFIDSDCVPLPGLLDGYASGLNGAVGYAGMVRALNPGRLPAYYESQRILVPPPNAAARPCYLVTANTLIWRAALEVIGGFDERFPLAAGEDIDLAYRLLGVGDLSYAPDATVLHDFEPDVASFVKRFVRYGRGNARLESLYQQPLRPTPFVPARATPFNVAAGALQYASMLAGYLHEARRLRRASHSAGAARNRE